MNQKIYNEICAKKGHNWAFKDGGEWVLKKCLYCGCEQYFIPDDYEEVYE